MHSFLHIHHISTSYLSNFYTSYQPVFVLNTGRSGSAFVNNLLQNIHDIKSYHEASPNMFLQSNYAYHNQEKKEVLQKMFEVARIELMLEASLKKKIYVESNQCLVFFIYQIKRLFPKAKFIHLTRHPGDFVTSAIKKGWHKNDSVWEYGRVKMEDEKRWMGLSQIERLGWVWKETHSYIEDFKSLYPKDFLTLKLEDITTEASKINTLLKFIGSENRLDEKKLASILQKKINEVKISEEPKNMYKLATYPNYLNWSDSEKVQLKNFVSETASLYQYIV
ncbi:sulfotransferase [Bizionia paragorgiae]|uniref:sulfotransferase n=1 Tax=Bizionia paragorgiae TaxID=283786 RepID=UPI003A92737F